MEGPYQFIVRQESGVDRRIGGDIRWPCVGRHKLLVSGHKHLVSALGHTASLFGRYERWQRA